MGAFEVVEEEEEEDRKDFIVMLLEGPQEENLLAFRERLRRPVVLYPMREQERERERGAAAAAMCDVKLTSAVN